MYANLVMCYQNIFVNSNKIFVNIFYEIPLNLTETDQKFHQQYFNNPSQLKISFKIFSKFLQNFSKTS